MLSVDWTLDRRVEYLLDRTDVWSIYWTGQTGVVGSYLIIVWAVTGVTGVVTGEAGGATVGHSLQHRTSHRTRHK